MSDHYKELIGISGGLKDGDKIQASADGLCYIVVRDKVERVLLYVGRQNDGYITISRQISGDIWESLGVVQTNHPIKVDIEVAAPNVRVFVNGQPIESGLCAEQVYKIAGVGEWTLDTQYHGIEEAKSTVWDGSSPGKYKVDTKRKLIFDIGMHNGNDTEFYLRKGFSVVAVDANPLLCAFAARRFKQEIKCNKLVVANIGIGSEAQKIPFFINKDVSEWSSFDEQIASRGHPIERVEINVLSCVSLSEKFGKPYYVKIDIEGADDDAVSSLVDNNVRPNFISFEHGNEVILDKLVCAGYKRFKLVNQAKVPEFSGRLLEKEGNAIEHEFLFGSSGPFGKDLGDDWLTESKMKELLEATRASADLNSADWFDLHAALG